MRRRISFKKVGCLVVVALVILFIGISALVTHCNKPPDPVTANYIVETGSRVYLCDSYDNVTGIIYIEKFYTLEKGKWRYHDYTDRPLEISDAFGNVRISAQGVDDIVLPRE